MIDKNSVNRTQGFCVTDWNENSIDDYKKIMKKNKIKFIAFGKELCPKTKTQHNQCFLYFAGVKSTSKSNLNKIANYFGKKHCHVQPMRGSFEQNEKYCEKDGEYEKIGIEPKQGLRGDLNETKDEIIDGKLTPDDIALQNPMMNHMYGRTLDRIHTIALRRRWRKKQTICVWYYGESGAGKSHKAFDGYDPVTHYVKDLTEGGLKWWDGYSQQDTVILNEFRGQIKFHEMLVLIDKWPHNVSIRGRESIPFTSKKIIVTSVKTPEQIYKKSLDEQELANWEQWERRVTTQIVHRSSHSPPDLRSP